MIANSDGLGGAARAAQRFFECQYSEGKDVSRIDILICRVLDPNNKNWKTAAYFGVLKARQLNNSGFDVINLHWIGHGLISIRQLLKIEKPIIWTLHDEWALNSFAHYSFDFNENSLTKSYFKQRRLNSKKRLLQKSNLFIVTLNTSIASRLIREVPHLHGKIFIIPNPLNTDKFFPVKKFNTKAFEISPMKPFLLYLGGEGDPRKGFDLLLHSLELCRSNFDLIIIGEKQYSSMGLNSQIQIKSHTKIESVGELREIYSRAHAVLIPSRAEGLPQVATEALSCGTPIVGFDIPGLTDIVREGINGYLVKPFDVHELAKTIDKITSKNKNEFSKSCRDYALKNFSYKTISRKFDKVIELSVSIVDKPQD
jgi:glycosyltransferase involved in cell wall biosynthesis